VAATGHVSRPKSSLLVQLRTHSTGHFLSYKSRRAWIYTSRSYGYSRSRNLVDGDRVHCALVVELTIRNLALSKLNDHVIGHLCR